MTLLKTKGLAIGVAEISRLFGHRTSKVRALAKKGAFKAKKVGGVWVCFAEDYVNYLASITDSELDALLASPPNGVDTP